MAIYLESVIVDIVESAGENLVQQGVSAAKSLAPHDSGALEGSIHGYKTGLARWEVTTASAGENGFEYPARIELGQPVVPSGRYVHKFADGTAPAIWFKGKWHKGASPSAKSHFMRKAMATMHI